MTLNTDRRGFIGLSAAAAASLSLPANAQAQQRIRSTAHIVIIGAGAGGAALANRLAERLDGARITIIDPRREHLYQPGLSLVAAGLKPPSYVVSRTTDWLPRDATLISSAATSIDPEAKRVETEDGQALDYDFLVVAPGLVLDHDAIEGFSLDLVARTVSARFTQGRNMRARPGRRPRNSRMRAAQVCLPAPRPR